jgi:hypothetical protein
MTGRRRWWWRLAGGVIAFAAIEGGTVVIHGQADELRLALVVALVVCAAALLVDAAPVEPAVWSGHVEAESGLGRLDPRTATYLRIIEGHLSARDPDGALRNRLRELAGQTLHVRHDLTLDDPRAEALLGPELRRVIGDIGGIGVTGGTATRLDPDQIDRCVTRIEEL